MTTRFDLSSWTSFTKKQGLDYDDGALIKAFAKFDKTDASKPEAHLDALKQLIAQIDKQLAILSKRKKELGDKPFTLVKDKLHELRTEAEGIQKQVRAAALAAADGDEEADSPVLLTSKMLPLVRRLRKGDIRMPVLVTRAGKDVAVLIMQRSISPARRKLMTEFLGIQGGAKHFTGECVFEAGALTFVMTSPPAGLAKQLRAALLQQLELRLKVRVRGDDGAEDEDGEDHGDSPEDQAASADPAATIPVAPTDGPPSTAALAYAQRLAKIQPRLDQALRDHHPAAGKARAVIGFASEKAAAHDYPAASKALDMLEKLLYAPVADAQPSADAQAYAQRVATLQPLLEQALRKAPGEMRKPQALSEFARDKAASGNHAAALQALHALEKALADIAAPIGQGDAPVNNEATQILQDRLRAVREDVRKLGALPQFGREVGLAEEAVKTHAGDASAQLDVLELRLVALAREQRAATAAATIVSAQTAGGVGVVEFAKMRLELKNARQHFDEAIDNLKFSFEALLESDDFAEDPRSTDPATLLAIDTLEQRLPSFQALAETISDTIDDMAAAPDPTQRSELGAATLKKIADFRRRIDAEPVLTEMQSTEAGNFPIHTTMVSALDKIAAALGA